MRESNIILPDDGSCAICAYLTGDRPFTILWRGDQCAVLVTREQRGKPHLLVVPLIHRTLLSELTDEQASALILTVRDTVHLIDHVSSRKGVAVWQNNGTPAHQTVSHVHFHVAGTLDEGGTDWGEVPELTVQQTDAIADQLSRGLEGWPRQVRTPSPKAPYR